MEKIFNHLGKVLLTIAFLMMFSLVGYSNPPGGATTPNPGSPDTAIPLDGGVTILLVAGAAYGAKKIYNRKKEME